MKRQTSARRTQQGYVLLFVVLLSAAIATAAASMALTAEVESRASNRNVKGVQALAVAYAGLQRGLMAVRNDGSGALAALKLFLLDAPNGDNATVNGIPFYRWDPPYTGTTLANPRHATANVAVGGGYFRLFLVNDVEDSYYANKDTNQVLVIRSFGWVPPPGNPTGDSAEAMVEATYRVPILTTFPGAFVGCFEDADSYVDFGAAHGPGWPNMLWRFDGTFDPATGKPKPAILTSVDSYRMNGFMQVRTGAGDPAFTNKWLFRDNPERPTTDYQLGGPFFTWFGWGVTGQPTGTPASTGGTYSVIDEGHRPAGNVTIGPNQVGVRPLGLYTVPRGVYTKNKDTWDPGTAFGTSGRTLYKTPIIAWGHVHDNVVGWEKAESDFNAVTTYHDGDYGDEQAQTGFYGCPNTGDNQTDYGAIGECISGTTTSGASTAVSSGSTANRSGLAWNVIQTVLRKCSGSGDGARCCNASGDSLSSACDGDYSAFDNVAKCLILPASVKRNWGGFGGVIGAEANYKDRKASSSGTSQDAAPNPGTNGKVWWSDYYQRVKVPSGTASGWTALDRTKYMAQAGLCTTEYPSGWVSPTTGHIYWDSASPTYCGSIGYQCTTSEPANNAPCGRALVKYCNKSNTGGSRVNGTAKAFNGTSWTDVDCFDAAAWAPESCDDGLSMALTDYFGKPTVDADSDGMPENDQCDSPSDAPGCCNSTSLDWTASDAAVRRINNWTNHMGNFTSCSDTCAFEWAPGADGDGGAAIGSSSNRTTSGTNYWRSVCLNLDPFHVHNYGPANSPTQKRGERGSADFISRLDLTDDGPLGTCNHANTALKITKDRGTCRSYGVNNYSSLPTQEDSGTYTGHPGRKLSAPFSRTVDDQDPWLPATRTPNDFCTAATGDSSELLGLLDDLFTTAATTSSIESTWSGTSNITNASAECEYSTAKVDGVELGWYVKRCINAGIYKYNNSSSIGKIICGCGLITFQAGGGVGKLRMDGGNKEALVWRGLVTFYSSGNDTEIVMSADGSNDKLLFVDGGFLSVMTGAGKKFQFRPTLDPGDSAKARTFVRFNQKAIDEALNDITLPVRGFRVVY